MIALEKPVDFHTAVFLFGRCFSGQNFFCDFGQFRFVFCHEAGNSEVGLCRSYQQNH